MGKTKRIVTLFAAVVALTLAPFWCGTPGLSSMHGDAMAAPGAEAGDCAGHACHETAPAGDPCCVAPDMADFHAMPQIKIPVTTLGHQAAATPPLMPGPPLSPEIRRVTGFSPAPPVSDILRTLFALQVLLLI